MDRWLPIPERKPVVALSGRSNSGKSSLINRLMGQRVARVSQTPGCTRRIDFYPAREGWIWADLPGYGYAQVGQKTRLAWQGEVRDFLQKRRPLTCVIIDSRLPPQKLDQLWLGWLAQEAIPFVILANKVDRLAQKDLVRQKKLLLEAFPVPLYWGWISARTGEGIPAFLEWLRAHLASS